MNTTIQKEAITPAGVAILSALAGAGIGGYAGADKDPKKDHRVLGALGGAAVGGVGGLAASWPGLSPKQASSVMNNPKKQTTVGKQGLSPTSTGGPAASKYRDKNTLTPKAAEDTFIEGLLKAASQLDQQEKQADLWSTLAAHPTATTLGMGGAGALAGGIMGHDKDPEKSHGTAGAVAGGLAGLGIGGAASHKDMLMQLLRGNSDPNGTGPEGMTVPHEDVQSGAMPPDPSADNMAEFEGQQPGGALDPRSILEQNFGAQPFPSPYTPPPAPLNMAPDLSNWRAMPKVNVGDRGFPS